MKNNPRNNAFSLPKLRVVATILLLLSLGCVTNAWLPQRNLGLSRLTTPAWLSQRQRSNAASMPVQSATPHPPPTKITATLPEANGLHFRFPHKRVVLKRLAAGLVCMMLLPLRVSASTVPLAAAGESAVAAAETAAAASAPAAAAAAAYCAAPPVPASVETKLTIRLIYAALLGAGLGKERSFAKHSAGVRTMALVAMGASAYTVCSAYGFANFGHYDPGRMASNVASGVGFVGAGVITTSASRNQSVVHGLTTAATIWLSAAVGVACGVGLFRIATTAAVATVTILRLGRRKPNAAPQQQKAAASSFAHAEEDDEDTFDYSQRQTLEDHYADTHDTSDWDEKQDEDVESPNVEFFSKRHEEQQPIVVTEDAAIGNMVERAWRNSTDFQFNSTTLVTTGTTAKEQQERTVDSSRRRP